VNSLEDRLRDAYRGAAETVRPERIPAPRWAREQVTRRGPSGRRAGRPAWRKLAPLAASAAVVVVAVGAALIVPRVYRGTGTAPTLSTPAPVGPAPKFMVIATSVAGSSATEVQYAPLQVQDAATGRVVSTVPTPQANTMWTAAASVNDNTFILAAEPKLTGCYTLLYKLTLTTTGTPASLTPLDVPRISDQILNETLTASANGMVGYASVPCPSSVDGTTTIGIIDTATAQARRWTIPTGAFITGGLALSADGSVLALGIPDSNFVPVANLATAPPRLYISSVWVLRTDSAPGPIEQRAQQILTLPNDSELTGSLLISSDGSTVYVVTDYRQTARQFASRVAAYDVATGDLLRVVRTGWHLLVQGISADPAVDHAVVWAEGLPEPEELDLATGQVHVPPASLPRGFSPDDVAW
jgi:hypothetical protein